MKTLSPATNDIVLIVINDGNGSQCGMTYPQRVAAAESGIEQYRAACKKANEWRIRHDCPSASQKDIIDAASEVQDYYRNHVAENARMARES